LRKIKSAVPDSPPSSTAGAHAAWAGASVSAFKPMAIPPELDRLIKDRAR